MFMILFLQGCLFLVKIKIVIGPSSFFDTFLPDEYLSIEHYVRYSDSIARNLIEKYNVSNISDILNDQVLVSSAASYSMISTSAIENFSEILSDAFLYANEIILHNPPEIIFSMIESSYEIDYEYEVLEYKYPIIDRSMLKEIFDALKNKIVGQDISIRRIMGSIYELAKEGNNSPVVIMLYGSSGIGKTETAKIIGKILGGNIMRKQLSMYKSENAFAYIFGSEHNRASFSKDLLNRETNVILLDEFDKAHPEILSAFYQMFDEGIFQDTNYRVNLGRSLIICTSNFMKEEEIRRSVGEPIYFRFDNLIKYEDLDEDSLKELIMRIFTEIWTSLSDEEKAILNKEKYLLNRYTSLADKFLNYRHIKKLINQDINSLLVDKIIEK